MSILPHAPEKIENSCSMQLPFPPCGGQGLCLCGGQGGGQGLLRFGGQGGGQGGQGLGLGGGWAGG